MRIEEGRQHAQQAAARTVIVCTIPGYSVAYGGARYDASRSCATRRPVYVEFRTHQSAWTVMPGLAYRTPRLQFWNELPVTTTSRPPFTRTPVSESMNWFPMMYCWLSWSSR